jgi:hypothetical protein
MKFNTEFSTSKQLHIVRMTDHSLRLKMIATTAKSHTLKSGVSGGIASHRLAGCENVHLPFVKAELVLRLDLGSVIVMIRIISPMQYLYMERFSQLSSGFLVTSNIHFITPPSFCQYA